MKLAYAVAAISMLISGCTGAQLPLYGPKPDMMTPVAARCDVSSCQARCYVSRSQCDRNDDSGCGTKTQACLQACTSQCR